MRSREVINKDMDSFSCHTKSHVGRKDEWRNTKSTEEQQIGIDTCASNEEERMRRRCMQAVCYNLRNETMHTDIIFYHPGKFTPTKQTQYICNKIMY